MDAWSADDLGPGRRPGADAADGPRDARRGGPSSGVLTRLDAMAVGLAAWRLGAGRARRRTRSRPVPASSGTPGPATPSPQGQPLLTLHTDEPDRFERALASLEGGYDVGRRPVTCVRHRRRCVLDADRPRTGSAGPLSEEQQDDVSATQAGLSSPSISTT